MKNNRGRTAMACVLSARRRRVVSGARKIKYITVKVGRSLKSIVQEREKNRVYARWSHREIKVVAGRRKIRRRGQWVPAAAAAASTTTTTAFTLAHHAGAPSASHLHDHGLSTDRTHHPHTANPSIMRRPCYDMPRHAGRSLWIHAMTSPAIRHINHDRPRRQRQSPPPRGDDSRRGGDGERRA